MPSCDRAWVKIIKPDQHSIRFYGLCACWQGKVERVGGEPLLGNAIFLLDGDNL